MNQNASYDLRAIACQFLIYGEFRQAEPWGTGHINDTYAVVFDQGGTPVRYILQRINQKVFQNPPALMENIHSVTTHLGAKLAGKFRQQFGGALRPLVFQSQFKNRLERFAPLVAVLILGRFARRLCARTVNFFFINVHCVTSLAQRMCLTNKP